MGIACYSPKEAAMYSDKLLAFYNPGPSHEDPDFYYSYTYLEEDLKNADIVEEVFDYCQILDGVITKKGWDFLISYWGIEKLYEIDKKSGWYDCDTIEEYKLWLDYELETSPEL